MEGSVQSQRAEGFGEGFAPFEDMRAACMRRLTYLVVLQLGPPVVPFHRFFFGWEGSPTKINYRKKRWYPCSNLSTGPRQGESVVGDRKLAHEVTTYFWRISGETW